MSAEARRWTSIGLAVAGAALALVGGFALYAREEVFEAKSFARNGSESLRDERVRAALTDPIVEQVIDNGPDQLINARPLIVTAVSQAIGSGPFRELFRKSAVQIYRAMFSKDREQIFLTIDDVDTIVADAASSISPKVGDRVPRDFGRKLVRITDNKTLIQVADSAQQVRVLGLILPILALGCLIGAVAVAPDRRQGLLVTSGSLAVAAALGLVVLLTARSLLVSRFDADVTQDAVRGVWDAFFGGLRTWTLVVGGGAVVVAAAAASARQLDPEAPARRVMRVLGLQPKTQAGRVGRAVGIAALGLFVVLRPDLAVNIAAVLFGAYALFYASCELMAMIAPPRERQLRLRKPTGREVALTGAAVVAIGAMVGLAIVLIDGDKRRAGRPPGPVVNCNGYPELCDRRLNEISFEATHNAMSAAQLPGWFTPNQRFGVQRQLSDGVRAFLIDSHYGITRESGPVFTDLDLEGGSKVIEEVKAELGPEAAARFSRLSGNFARRGGEGMPARYFCHVVCELGANTMQEELGWFREFLDTHPDEVIVLFVEDKVSPEDTAEEFKRAGLLDYVYTHGRGEPLPTLREMIDTDRRLFVMAEENGGDPAIPWYHDGFELAQETPYTFNKPEQLADYEFSCQPNRGDGSSPVFQLNHWIESIPRSPAKARVVNDFAFLEARARECQRRRGLLPTLLAVDFYNEGAADRVARVLNGLGPDEEPSYRTTDP